MYLAGKSASLVQQNTVLFLRAKFDFEKLEEKDFVILRWRIYGPRFNIILRFIQYFQNRISFQNVSFFMLNLY